VFPVTARRQVLTTTHSGTPGGTIVAIFIIFIDFIIFFDSIDCY
jgi:hypothetical protein